MNRPGPVKDQTSVQKQVDIYLETHSHLELLRLVTCGSVGGGKSALIKRILHDAQRMFEDQVTAPQQASRQVGTQGDAIDSVTPDGLAPEREQGITLNATYRFFNTDKRKFIIADTPGHEQYTRNMVTGAATADVAVLLIDASQGIVTQTRRHSLITSLLGIKHLVLAVNKMELVGFKQEIFDSIVASYRGFAKQLNFTTLTAIPLSALGGDNVTGRSNQTSWYKGQTLLEFLETVAVRQAQLNDPFCFPVRQVNRSSSEARGYVGTVVSGSINKDQEVCVLPSGQVALVADILLNDECLDSAIADQAVTITLNKNVDISSGDILVTPNSPWEVSDQFEVSVVWMHANPGFVGRAYRMIIGTQDVNATITNIKYKYNINTFEHLSSKALRLNEIGKITLSLDKPVVFEPYAVCRAMGAFVLMDSYSQAPAGAGMINFALRRAQNIRWQALEVNKSARARLNGHPGKVIWFTGLSGSGKSTIALEQKLHDDGIHTYILDGDNVRQGLNKDLGFTDADRIENIRRIAEVAKLMVDAGIVALTAFISPFRSERDMARSLFEADEFVEIHVSLPLEIAEQRDPKGLYKKARRGDLPHFTAIDSVYEAPVQPDLKIETADLEIDDCVALVIRLMDKMRWI